MKNYVVLLTYRNSGYMADFRIVVRGESFHDVRAYIDTEYIPIAIPSLNTSLPYTKNCTYSIKDIAVLD